MDYKKLSIILLIICVSIITFFYFKISSLEDSIILNSQIIESKNNEIKKILQKNDSLTVINDTLKTKKIIYVTKIQKQNDFEKKIIHDIASFDDSSLYFALSKTRY